MSKKRIFQDKSVQSKFDKNLHVLCNRYGVKFCLGKVFLEDIKKNKSTHPKQDEIKQTAKILGLI